MPQNVLIATLGESPIIVTSMVKALREKKWMTIDQLHVVHPQSEEQLIDLGYEMICEHLAEECVVAQCVLPFPDTNSRETSMTFLQTLSGLIQSHEEAKDNVYLSLAGGRKNMSALMAVTCQFFECVRGLYHILDKHEDDPKKRNFHSIEALCDFGEGERSEKLSPPADDLILVEIPYPRLSNPIALRQYFSEAQSNPDAQTPIEIEGELNAFYREIFQQKKIEDLLDVYLSKEAYDQFKKIHGATRQNLMNCFRSMRYPQLLKSRGKSLSKAKTDCTPFKMGRTAERPFYYRTNGEVVVCEIALKNTTYPDIIAGRKEIWSKDHDKFVPVNKLKEDSILIVPLGKSPMVVTQTFALLSKREGVKIKKIIVIQPRNAEISNGVELVQEAFRRKFRKHKSQKDLIRSHEIPNIQDVASENNCMIYLKKLVSVIEAEQKNNPDKSIHLSLSGGRKGMAALTLFATQQANIDAVYHTLITDIELEKKIEEETTLDKLQSLTRSKRIERLFLDAYDESKFELFRVPVIPLRLLYPIVE